MARSGFRAVVRIVWDDDAPVPDLDDLFPGQGLAASR